MFTVSKEFKTVEEAVAWLEGKKEVVAEVAPAPAEVKLTPAQKAAATRARKKAEKEAEALAKPAVQAEVVAPIETLVPVVDAPVVETAPPAIPPVIETAPVVDRQSILGEITTIVGKLLATAEKDLHTTYFTNLVRHHNANAIKASDLTEELPAFLRDLQTYEGSLQTAQVGQPLV